MASDTRSFGGALWEWLHPEQVQAEYAAVGAAVPSIEDIRAQAIYDASVATGETADSVIEKFQSAASAGLGTISLVALGALAIGLVFLSGRKR